MDIRTAMPQRKKIVFIKPFNPYLPELKAYLEYFSMQGYEVQAVKNIHHLKGLSYDVEWHFMGFDKVPPKKGVIKIHEFGSLSTPPFSGLKNKVKKLISCKPHLRVFLNDAVKNKFAFKDNIPSCIRDMGVGKAFLNAQNLPVNKEFDFCYLGNMHKLRQLEDILVYFKERLQNKSILLIGEPTPYLITQYGHCSNIHFTGMLNYDDVPKELVKCNYAINYVPSKHPFNIQTSTKLLDYCACGLKVISNKYEWIEKFESEKNASFFYLNDDFSNFTWENLEAFSFKNPDLHSLEWNNIIEKSGLALLLAGLLQ